MVGLNTRNISIDESENSLKVRVEYSLDINYQHVSECNIVVDIQSRLSGAGKSAELALKKQKKIKRKGPVFSNDLLEKTGPWFTYWFWACPCGNGREVLFSSEASPAFLHGRF